MLIVDYGIAVALLALFVILVGFGVASLMGWSFVHDKLRAETKEDKKEK